MTIFKKNDKWKNVYENTDFNEVVAMDEYLRRINYSKEAYIKEIVSFWKKKVTWRLYIVVND